MKQFADRQRREVQYEVGQLVYVKLRPHRQLSVPTDKPNKLTKRYFGPFCILKRIGQVAYRLQLPPGSKIHPVFHCSMLRPHHGPFELQTSSLPPEAIHNQPLLKPLAILGSRMDSSTSPPTRSVLVQWAGLPPKDSTWENWEDARGDHHLEDKVSFPGEGNDSSTATLHQEERPQR